MKKIYKQITCLVIAIIATTYLNPLNAQVIITIAGTGTVSFTGDGGQSTVAQVNHPQQTTVDALGNIYFADRENNRVRKIDPAGIITTFAGNGVTGSSAGDGGAATAAALNRPAGVAVDGLGNVYISEFAGSRIRKVDAFGNISTFASAGIIGPTGLCLDASGNLYVAAQAGRKVIKVTPGGIVSTVAGTGAAGACCDGGPATAATVSNVTGVAVDGSGNIYFTANVSPGPDCRVRKVDPSGIITTVAGGAAAGFSGDGGPATAATLNNAMGCTVDAAGNVYFADQGNNRIRMINVTTGNISTVVGTGTSGYNGNGIMATAANITPNNPFIDAIGNIYFSDGPAVSATRVRKVMPCISGLPVVSPTSGPTNVCQGTTITVSNSTPGGAWSVSHPAIGTVDGAGVVTGISGGEDTIKYTVINGCGSTVVKHVVTVDPLPVVGAISGPPDVCVASNITLTNATPGGTWSVTNGRAAVTSGGLVTGVTAGVDTINYAVANACGTSSVTMEVTVNPLPFAGTISGLSTVCIGSAITLTNSVSGGAWSAVNTNATVTGGGIVVGVNPGVDTIQYMVANMCGTATASREVTVTATPAVDPIVGSPVVCIGTPSPMTNTTPGGTWSITNANATISSTGDVTGVTAGLDTVQYTVTLPCGTTTVSYYITVDALPTVGAISGLSDVCVGATITLTNPSLGGIWYAYNPSASVSGTGDVTGVYVGSDTITYTVYNTCGSAVVAHYVTVHALPDSGTISGTSAICVGGTTSLANPSPGGIWSITNPNATITIGGVVAGVTGGLDTALYSVTNFCGTATAMFPMTIVPLADAGLISGPSVVCEAATITVTDPVSGGLWSAVDTNISVSPGGVVTGLYPGVDTVVYTYTNMCGTDVTTYAVTINPLPHAGTVTGPASVCVGATITVADTATGGAWSAFGSLVTIGTGSGTVTGVAVGVDTVAYTVINSCGTDIAKRAVTVNDVPVVAPVTGPSAVCVGSSITVATASTGGVWSKSNTSVNINSGGLVTGVAVGTVVISYTRTNVCGSTSSTKTVNVLTVPVAGTVTGPSEICINKFHTLVPSIPGGTWVSSDSDALVDATGIVSGFRPGSSVITYTVSNICGSASTTFTVTVLPDSVGICNTVGIELLANTETSLKVFPNPSSGSFTFLMSSVADEQVSVAISNVLGETVKTFITTTNKETEISFGMPAGVYLMSANTAAHGRRTARIIVE